MGDVTKTRRCDWNVKWNAVDLGYVDEVDPDFSIVAEPIMVGTLGNMKLGERIISVDGSIKVQVREVTLARFQQLTPWWSSGSIPLVPSAPNVDFYTYAQVLNLHPSDLVPATVNEDINLVKAYPIGPPAKIKRDGKKDDVWLVTFNFLPDRAKLTLDPPQIVYGYVGAIPA